MSIADAIVFATVIMVCTIGISVGALLLYLELRQARKILLQILSTEHETRPESGDVSCSSPIQQ